MTGPNGAYSLADLPVGEILIRASRAGYYARPAQTLVNCLAQRDYPQNDFELLRAGVVSGRVVDETGEPMEGARIVIRQSKESGPASEVVLPAAVFTDDRGMFRVAGLEPGPYVLTVRSVDFASFLAVNSVSVTVEAGAETRDVVIAVERSQRVPVSGTVTGINTADGKARILFQNLAAPRIPLPRAVGKDGQFVAQPELPVGRYRVFGAAMDPKGRETKVLFLPSLDVHDEIRDLALRPLPGATVRGRVTFASGTPRSPLQLVLTLEGIDTRRVEAAPPDFSFEVQNLAPGSYSIQVESPAMVLKEIAKGEESGPPRLISVGPGETASLAIVTTTGHGRVYGVVQAQGIPLPRGRVALEGAGGVRLEEADASGRFQFADVAPGRYRICAWRDIVPEALGREDTWKKAGCAERRFPVASGAAVELAVTAAP